MIDAVRRRPEWLLAVPAATYVLSWIYLAWYHGTPWLLGTVVHESGRYTLLENMLYAPHFLGHIPVHLILALLMVGAYRSLATDPAAGSRRELVWSSAALVVLVGLSALGAVVHWGGPETWEFVVQQRQRPDLMVPGGAWLLHLPSTLGLVLGVPLTVIAVRWFFRRPTGVERTGAGIFGVGAFAAVAVTAGVVPDPLATTLEVLRDPRYLGHSVRELATFPLTYFPLPLAWWLAREGGGGFRWSRRLVATTAAVAVSFAAVLAYQVAVPLGHGIGELAQQPDFAHGGELSIAYLLASHFFEHLLDSLFFALACVAILAALPRAGR